MPVFIRDYTDFYSSYSHAFNVGTMIRGAGQEIQPNFEDTDVEMPIVAVTDISKKDLEVSFREDESELVSANTGRRSKFMKQRGVYFMKMFYKKDKCQEDGSGCDCEQQSSFTRPGTP